MAASGLKQGTRMASCIWGIAAILGLGAALFAVRACFSSLVFASYPGSFEFTGRARFWSTNYFVLKWVQGPGNTAPCSVVVHTDSGDVDMAVGATHERLLKMGWVVVPAPPMPREALELLGPDPIPGLPQVVKYRWDELRVALQHTEGVLMCVWVFVVEPGGEHAAFHRGTTPYPISVHGQRITLPVSEAELIDVLGSPENRRRDY